MLSIAFKGNVDQCVFALYKATALLLLHDLRWGWQELRRAYRDQALRHHPDKNPERIREATEKFKLVAEAYSVLKDPKMRAAYDKDSNSFSGEGASKFTFEKASDLYNTPPTLINSWREGVPLWILGHSSPKNDILVRKCRLSKNCQALF